MPQSPQRPTLGAETRLILGQQLRKAREAVALSIDEVSRAIQVPESDLAAWEHSRVLPTLETLEQLAQLYGRGINYFLRKAPPLPADKIRFRSTSKETRLSAMLRESRTLIAKFDELCRTAHELEKALNIRRGVSVKDYSRLKHPSTTAESERDRWGLDGKPVKDLRGRLEELGIRIFELPVESHEFSGFSYWHEEYGPCVLLNAMELPGRRNFTLAHEYAHLLYRDEPSACEIAFEALGSEISCERAANQFSVAFLLPSKGITEDFKKRGLSDSPALREIGNMAGSWAVSVQAMAYRLEQLDLIRRGYAEELLRGYEEKPPRFRSRTPTWKRRLGKTYVNTALEAYRGGHITLGKLAKSLGIPLRKALDVAKRSIS